MIRWTWISRRSREEEEEKKRENTLCFDVIYVNWTFQHFGMKSPLIWTQSFRLKPVNDGDSYILSPLLICVFLLWELLDRVWPQFLSLFIRFTAFLKQYPELAQVTYFNNQISGREDQQEDVCVPQKSFMNSTLHGFLWSRRWKAAELWLFWLLCQTKVIRVHRFRFYERMFFFQGGICFSFRQNFNNKQTTSSDSFSTCLLFSRSLLIFHFPSLHLLGVFQTVSLVLMVSVWPRAAQVHVCDTRALVDWTILQQQLN